MWRILVIVCIVCVGCMWYRTPVHAATTITVTNADKVYNYVMKHNTTLNTVLANAPATLIIEGANQYAITFSLAPVALQTIYTSVQAWIFVDHADTQMVPVLTLAPSDLQAIYTALQARIFVDHADTQMVPVLTLAPSDLQAIYTALQARIFVDHADAQMVPVLVPVILDNGVPTSTLVRAAVSMQQIMTTPTPDTQQTTPATVQIIPSTVMITPTPIITHTMGTMQPTTTVILAPSETLTPQP